MTSSIRAARSVRGRCHDAWHRGPDVALVVYEDIATEEQEPGDMLTWRQENGLRRPIASCGRDKWRMERWPDHFAVIVVTFDIGRRRLEKTAGNPSRSRT